MIELPKACVVDKFVPKKTFYEKVNIPNSIREEFIDKLSKIYWRYKLSEETINTSKTEKVEEIEIFELELKEKYNCKNVIKIITKKIPYPILFFIKFNNEFQYAAKYNEDIIFSEWNEMVTYCNSALNLEILYDNMIKSILKETNDIDLEGYLSKKNENEQLKNELIKLENLLKREKQFNKKVELNEKINRIKEQLKGE